MAILNVTGPASSVERLAQHVRAHGLECRAADGVFCLPADAMHLVVDGAAAALAPLEATLVRVVTGDLDGDAGTLVARAAVAPTLANLVARQRNHQLLAAIADRSAVTVGFQPVFDLAARRVIGYEALLRVRVGGRDVPPAEVLAAAEDAGRLVSVDAVAREVAVAEAAADLGNRLLFINILPASMPVPPDQLEPLADRIAAAGLAVERVVLEAPVGPVGVLRRQLQAVFATASRLGFLVGLDNVRSERDLDAADVRADVVKLDRSLARGLPSPSAIRNLRNVVHGSHDLAARVVAQGLETPDQIAAVGDLGIRFAQGWALGRPGSIQPEQVDAIA